MGLKEAILTAPDLPLKPFSAPEWLSDGQLFLGKLTGIERDRFEMSLQAAPGNPLARGLNLNNARARFAVLVLRDANAVRVFSDDDAAQLGAKSAEVLDRIWDDGRAWNGLAKVEAEAPASAE